MSRVRKWVLAGALGLAAGSALPLGGGRPAAALDPALELLARAEQGRSAGDRRLEAARWDRLTGTRTLCPQKDRRVAVLVSVSDEHCAPPLRIFTPQARIGRILTGYVPDGAVSELARWPGVERIQASRRLTASARTDTVPTQAMPEPIRGSHPPPLFVRPEGLSGAGVLLAIVDTGVDITHRDFRNGDGTTRIKALLDFSNPGDLDGDGTLDGSGPFGGTLYTESDINAALAGSGSVSERDSAGHGTHALSVSAGGDVSFPGLAPSADLIVVKATRDSGSLSFWSLDVVNALAFIDAKAAELDEPYVANLSLGSLFSSHDGRSLEEQAIDSLVGPGIAGKAVVVAAGNASDNRGDHYRHFRGVVNVGTAGTCTMVLPPYTPNPGTGDDRALLDLWYQGQDRLGISVSTPGGHTVSARYGTFADETTPDGDVFIANMGGANPANGDTEAIVLVDDWSGTPPASGTWTVTVTGESVEEGGGFDGWLGEESVVGSVSPYLTTGADNLMLIGKPGCAYNAITVGSYALHDEGSRFRTSWVDVHGIPRVDTTAVPGDISDFSSPGGTRDGRQKPDLAAPGERVLGAVSRDAYPGVSAHSIYRYHPFPEPDALIVDATADRCSGLLQGTSFAAPVVSGLAARILSTDPSLDAVQVRNILLRTAQGDSFTGPLPNATWGYGKASLSVGGAPLPSPLKIATEEMAPAYENRAYTCVLSALGGTQPYSWSVSAGSLPGGVSLSGGQLQGTPSSSGVFSFTLQVTDAALPPRADSRDYALTVASDVPLAILSTQFPGGSLGRAYDVELEGDGGTPPFFWDVSSGSLPPGLTLAEGHISGAPTQIGSYPFTLKLSDSAGGEVSSSARIRVHLAGGAQWDPLGLLQTSVNQIALDPNDPSHLYASTFNSFDRDQNAVFESRDEGDSWQIISVNNGFNGSADILSVSPSTSLPWAVRHYDGTQSSGLFYYDSGTGAWMETDACTAFNPSIDALAFDPAGGTYAEGWTCSSSPGTLRASFDGGSSWTTLGALCGGGLQSGTAPGSLAVCPSDPSVLYATRAGYGGSSYFSVTCKSVDGGATWSEIGRVSGTGWSYFYFDAQPAAVNSDDVVRGLVEQSSVSVERSSDGGASWSKTAVGLLPGAPHVLRRSPSNPEFLVLAAGQALFKSADSGQTWTRLAIQGSTTVDAAAVAIHPTDPRIFYVGTTQGLFRTADGGQTWALKMRGLVHRGLTGVAVNFQAPDELLLTTSGGEPYLTRSSGSMWTKVSGPLGGFWSDLSRVSEADPNLYVANAHMEGLFRSDDRGLTWTSITKNQCTFCWAVEAAALDPNDADNMIMSVSGGDVLRSTDRGETWTVTAHLSVSDFAYAHDVPGRVYAASPYDGIFISEDGGGSWISAYNPYAADFTAIRAAPTDSRYVYAAGSIAAQGPRMFHRGPSGIWQVAATNPDRPILSLAVDGENPQVAYAGADHPGTVGGVGGLCKTTDGGVHWSRIPGVLDGFDVVSLSADPNLTGHLFAATREGGVYRSKDGGSTWMALDKYGTVADVVNVNVQSPSSPNLLFTGTKGYGVQASTDGGTTYAVKNAGLTNYYINSIAFDPSSSSTMYAGSDSGLFKSTDSGDHWSPTGLTGGKITDMATDNEGSFKRIWATVSGQGVAFSSDGGASFTTYSSGLASLELTGVRVEDNGTFKRIWATTRGGDGIYYSDDQGQTWKPASGNGLTNRNVNGMAIDGTFKRIWATTDGGVFYTSNSGLTWNELSQGLPPGIPATSIAINAKTGEAFVSLSSEDYGGVYRGGNVTGSWAEFSDGLESPKVNRLTCDQGRLVSGSTWRTTVYASTSGDGVYSSSVTYTLGTGPQVATASLPAAVERTQYSAFLAASGGAPPYSWSLTDGALPPGLDLNSVTGQISGRPGQAGHFEFAVQVSDSSALTGRKDLALEVTPANAAADLSLSMTASQDPASVGTLLTYTLTVMNEGPSTATASLLTDPLPGGCSFSSAATTKGACGFASGLLTCQLGSLTAGDRETVTVTVMPTAAGVLANAASLSAEEADPDPENNHATVATPVAPPCPTGPSPLDGASGVPLAPVLTWEAVPGADSYEVCFGTSAPPPLAGTVTSPAFLPGGLQPDTEYFWSLKAVAGALASQACPAWSFLTLCPPSGCAASPLPVDGATGVGLAPALSWELVGGASAYQVYFGATFPPPLVATVPAPPYSPGTLIGNTPYNWRVVPVTGCGPAPSCPCWSFRTLVPPRITGVTKAGSPPFRLKIIGSDFQQGARAKVDGQAVPATVFKSAVKLLAGSGSPLKAMVPKGAPVCVTVENPDGGQCDCIIYTR